MKKVYLFSVIFFCQSFFSFSQNLGFVEIANFPATGRDDATGFVINDRAYVGLGLLQGFALGDDFYAYSPQTNTWQSVASLPMVGRQYACGFSLNGFGYAVAGITHNNVLYKDVWRYDPVTNSWAQQDNFPSTKRYGLQSAVWNNQAYVFFGRDSSGFLGEVWKFNGTTWTQLPNFPDVIRYQSACVQLGSKAYFIGGYDNTSLLNEVWEFDLTTETWTQLANFPGSARYYAKGFVYDGKVVVGSGWTTTFVNDFWIYDPLLQVWTQTASLPELGRKGMMPFTIGGRAFIGLGVDTEGERKTQFWEFVANASMNETDEKAFTIFPNPATDFLQFEVSNPTNFSSYKIMDMTGKVVAQGLIKNKQERIEIAHLISGVYVLCLGAECRLYTEKFCVQSN